MAEGRRFACTNCCHEVVAWSDGNPYYFDDEGKKQYAYHPSEKFDLCVGNESPRLCLRCGKDYMTDSHEPVKTCPSCDGKRTADTYHLEGKKCPFCKKGTFERDRTFSAIS